MQSRLPTTSLELRSLVTTTGTLELSLAEVPVPVPAENQVLVRMDAAPINPSARRSSRSAARSAR